MAKFFAAFALTTMVLYNLTPTMVAVKPDYSILIPTTLESKNKLIPYKVPAHDCIINVMEGSGQLLELNLSQCIDNRNWLKIKGELKQFNI
tara:strand:- start:3527 stop:3799 length:273 start_codon:yes stop_codon:yes gene_type:complete